MVAGVVGDSKVAAKVWQELIDPGMTVDRAAEHQATEARIATAIAWLQGMLFSEEQDHIADSNADAADRRNGINPMSDEYLQQVNAKRLALGIPALAPSGFPAGNESYVFCETLVRELFIMLKR